MPDTKNEIIRSFMFYESFRDCMIGIKELGDYNAATALGWEILWYGFTGKRRCKLENCFAESVMRSFAPIIDKSVKNGEESLEKLKLDDEEYVRKLIAKRVEGEEREDY